MRQNIKCLELWKCSIDIVTITVTVIPCVKKRGKLLGSALGHLSHWTASEMVALVN